MKLQQLRFLAAVAQNGLNITNAASALHTSQPGVSKQIKMLEDELGFVIFERDGRQLTRVTPAGQEAIDQALKILQEVQNLRRLAADRRDNAKGSLSIGTTHTQARYVLPPIIQAFRQRYPEVDLHLHQGASEQIAEMAKADQIDFAINTGSEALFPDMVLLPAYRWQRQIIVPHTHPLARIEQPTLAQLAEWPLVTYVFSLAGRSSLPALFESAGLDLKVALTARDADVIKTYVRLGLGVGVVASTAMDSTNDADLKVIDAQHLFPPHVTWIGFRRRGLLRTYMRDFITLFAPHVSAADIEAAREGAPLSPTPNEALPLR
jgi:LysR family transcriptional regulator, cys regulon transcriptional activator